MGSHLTVKADERVALPEVGMQAND